MDRPLSVSLLALGSVVFGIFWIFGSIISLFLPHFLVSFEKLSSFGIMIILGKRLYSLAMGSLLILSGYWVWELREKGRTLEIVGGIMLIGYPLLYPLVVALSDEIIYRPSILSHSPQSIILAFIGIIIIAYLNRPEIRKLLTKKA